MFFFHFVITFHYSIPRCLFTVLYLDPVDALHLKFDDLVLRPVPALPAGAGSHLLCAQAPDPVPGEQGGVRQVTVRGNLFCFGWDQIPGLTNDCFN